MRGGARWALGVAVSLIAMGTISACAGVRSIDLGESSASSLSPATDDPAAAEDDAAASITLSRFGGESDDPNSSLVFDGKAVPAALADGLPSAIADVAAQTPDGEGVSPYAFFAEVIDVPHSADARAVPSFLSAPSLASRLSDFLWASNDFFGRPSGDITSRRSLPLSADADALYGALYGGPRMQRMQTRVTPTLSPSPLSEPPSSDPVKPFGQVGDEAERSAEFSPDGVESNK